MYEVQWKAGKRDGELTIGYQLHLYSGQYTNDERSGKWIYWYENGRIKEDPSKTTSEAVFGRSTRKSRSSVKARTRTAKSTVLGPGVFTEQLSSGKPSFHEERTSSSEPGMQAVWWRMDCRSRNRSQGYTNFGDASANGLVSFPMADSLDGTYKNGQLVACSPNSIRMARCSTEVNMSMVYGW